MQITRKTSIVLLGVGVFIIAGTAFAYQGYTRIKELTTREQPYSMKGKDAVRTTQHTSIENLPKEDLSAEEKAGLIKMREEERLAHDVYTTLGEMWGAQTFRNIAESEQRHTEEVRALLVKYGITNPVSNNALGVFSDPEMKTLYDKLVAEGSVSETAALRIGATVEDLDIADLTALLNTTDNADIRLVYENLLDGSKNHLRAFTRQLSRNNASYTPTYISADTYAQILAESGNGGSGKGRGTW